ncbi:heme-binding beta-barrel domain-containing protein, partial [Enterococcus hirae]|uniref:heme-binding beta-barrel domain-containing protein n=1 Tax=Enterococcus hirae TaxID=1354 RepID=UPI0013711836|nr:FABP family protein [Enterococcus hirae]
MPLEIDAGLPASLVPLSWLIGRWEGAGVLAAPEAGEIQVGQAVEVTADPRGFLDYR